MDQHLVDEVAKRVSERILASLKQRLRPTGPEYLSLKEAAAWCGLSPSSFDRLNRRGEGPLPTRFGDRLIRYKLADLKEWAETRAGRNQR